MRTFFHDSGLNDLEINNWGDLNSCWDGSWKPDTAMTCSKLGGNVGNCLRRILGQGSEDTEGEPIKAELFYKMESLQVDDIPLEPQRTIPFIKPIKIHFDYNSVEIESLHNGCPWSVHESGSIIPSKNAKVASETAGIE